MLDTKSIYQSGKFARAWHERQTKHKDFLRTDLMNPILLKEAGDLTGLSVLDAGCGNGFLLGDLVARKPNLLTAFDISSYLVRVAADGNPSADLAIGDAAAMPYESNVFDVVICYNVLMDLLDVPGTAQELSRVAKLNGVIHVVIVHPLYNLFVNDRLAQTESTMDRLEQYVREEAIHVTTIPGFENFAVYRRPLSYYLNAFSDAGLFLIKAIEVPIDKLVAGVPPSLLEKAGIPLFVYFKVQNRWGTPAGVD